MWPIHLIYTVVEGVDILKITEVFRGLRLLKGRQSPDVEQRSGDVVQVEKTEDEEQEI